MASLLKESPAEANRIVALAEPDTQEEGAPMPKKVEETKQKKQRGSKSRDEESESESESGSEPESSEPESEGSEPSGNRVHSHSHRSSQSVHFSGQDQIKEFDVDRSESSEPESEPGSEPEGPEEEVGGSLRLLRHCTEESKRTRRTTLRGEDRQRRRIKMMTMLNNTCPSGSNIMMTGRGTLSIMEAAPACHHPLPGVHLPW